MSWYVWLILGAALGAVITSALGHYRPPTKK